MKKMLTIVVLMLLTDVVSAQELAKFVLMPNGTYQTEDGRNFVVIQFDGKTAHQIYQELASNVGSTFNDPSKVMSGVEDASIKIRAFSNNLVMGKPFGYVKDLPYSGHYQLEFKIRDGRVRVSAPIIESHVKFIHNGIDGNFHKLVKKFFKNGVLQDKKRKNYNIIVDDMNSVINSILYTSKVQDTIEKW